MEIQDKKYCIVGTGGFGRETLLCLIESYKDSEHKIEEIAVFMVSDEYYEEPKIMGVPVIKLSEFSTEQYLVVVAIGDPSAREKMVHSLPKETSYTSIIHPRAVISEWVELGHGCIITAGVILTCNIKIANHAHLNLHTTVGHDCVIGNYFTSAPGANISGNCHFGERVYFGTSACSREGVTICSDVTIGMGGVVVKNIKEKGVYVGNPVKKLLPHTAS